MRHPAEELREQMQAVTREREALLHSAAAGKISDHEADAKLQGLFERVKAIQKALDVLREVESWKEDEEPTNG